MIHLLLVAFWFAWMDQRPTHPWLGKIARNIALFMTRKSTAKTLATRSRWSKCEINKCSKNLRSPDELGPKQQKKHQNITIPVVWEKLVDFWRKFCCARTKLKWNRTSTMLDDAKCSLGWFWGDWREWWYSYPPGFHSHSIHGNGIYFNGKCRQLHHTWMLCECKLWDLRSQKDKFISGIRNLGPTGSRKNFHTPNKTWDVSWVPTGSRLPSRILRRRRGGWISGAMDIGGYRHLGGFFGYTPVAGDHGMESKESKESTKMCQNKSSNGEFLHQELAAAMMEMTFNKNETIFEQGVPCFQNHTFAKFENAETIKIRRNICVFFLNCRYWEWMNSWNDVILKVDKRGFLLV